MEVCQSPAGNTAACRAGGDCRPRVVAGARLRGVSGCCDVSAVFLTYIHDTVGSAGVGVPGVENDRGARGLIDLSSLWPLCLSPTLDAPQTAELRSLV